jgi:citrate lyase gamma subunit
MVLLNGVFASGRKEGNGDIVLVNRDVSSFNSIELSSKATVNIYQNDIDKVTVEIDSNLEKYVKTNIRNNILEIKEKIGVSLNPNKYTVNVYVKNPSNIKISGQGNININNVLKTDSIKLEISGSGKIEGKIESNNLVMDISGSGEINVSGVSTQAEMRISGSGDINAIDMDVERAVVKMSGSGETRINAKNELIGKISGSGNIFYKGNPKIEVDISGKGKISGI